MRIFTLDVEPHPEQLAVGFRLGSGPLIAAHQVWLTEHSAWMWQGLFSTRDHVRRYTGPLGMTAEALLEQIGVFLGETVLGLEITAALARGNDHRTLLVRLPDSRSSSLAAALGRVPWEIARPGIGEAPLMARGLVVRAVTPGASDLGEQVVDHDPGEAIRVLLVFAQAQGSQPLALHRERERLLQLFLDEVAPKRNITVDLLCHGVTRQGLIEQIRDAGGYHIVHWSGYGHHDLLELEGETGTPDLLSGEQLVGLFSDAGGSIPSLVFLSACRSGSMIRVRDWDSLHAVLANQGRARVTEEPQLAQVLAERIGYTSTALQLLQAGVPQVVAMRFEAGDAYARRLALRFYRSLLAETRPRTADSALYLARKGLLTFERTNHHPVDHATALIFGAAQIKLSPELRPSRQLEQRRPRPQPPPELRPHASFVGRGRELKWLARQWLPRSGPAVALVQGLAGLGKTALAAEAINLWHRRFQYVLVFQARPAELQIEDFLRRLDYSLTLVSRCYRDACDQDLYQSIFLTADRLFTGPVRYQMLRDNLFAALRAEPILLVLDSFESNLQRHADDRGYRCIDPEWDRLLQALANDLSGTGSRLLVTSRYRIAALADEGTTSWLPLGPLPMPEAALLVQSRESLHRLALGSDDDRRLVDEALQLSRGHPLILQRLADLAGDPPVLARTLEQIRTESLQRLPDLFAGARNHNERENESTYLQKIAVATVDLLIARASRDARRLLWLVSNAFEPVSEGLIEAVRVGGGEVPPSKLLLLELRDSGLLGRSPDGITYCCHELVQERVEAWLKSYPEERDQRSQDQIWQTYGTHYGAIARSLMAAGKPGSQERAFAACRRGLSYLIRARAFDRLGSLVAPIVSGSSDPRLLRLMITELEALLAVVPEGWQWSLQTHLANALWKTGQPEQALARYEQAAAAAEQADHWSGLAWVCGHWALALVQTGRLEQARDTYLRSADADQRGHSAKVKVVSSQLEALRIDVIQGKAEQVLPEIEQHLEKLRGWRQRIRAGKKVAEAPDQDFLGRVLLAALDIAEAADSALDRWQACLERHAERELVRRDLGESEHELARTRFDRYGPLLLLGRLDEARQVLEGCLALFNDADDIFNLATAFSALADLSHRHEDHDQAVALERQALDLCNRLPFPDGRATSHANLCIYLRQSGQSNEARAHELASMIYPLVSSHSRQRRLMNALGRYRTSLGHAHESGVTYVLPRIMDLVDQPGFEALKRFLRERGVNLEQLQSELDDLLAQIEAELTS